MRNIIVFGNVPLATWVVEKIRSDGRFNFLGAVCDKYDKDAFVNHSMPEPSLYSYCVNDNIKIIGFEDAARIAKEEEVLGISIRYHRLFKKEYYRLFKPGIINLHGGELPKYRGANIANYAVLEGAQRVGGTLHFISEGIDEGDIVERSLIDFAGNITAYEFFVLTLDALKEAFLKFLNRPDVVDATMDIQAAPQSDYILNGEECRLYYKKEVEQKRIIEFDEIKDWDTFYRHARAYTFPGHQGIIIKNGDEYVEVKAIKNAAEK